MTNNYPAFEDNLHPGSIDLPSPPLIYTFLIILYNACRLQRIDMQAMTPCYSKSQAIQTIPHSFSNIHFFSTKIKSYLHHVSLSSSPTYFLGLPHVWIYATIAE